jgi:hypothetical protein
MKETAMHSSSGKQQAKIEEQMLAKRELKSADTALFRPIDGIVIGLSAQV